MKFIKQNPALAVGIGLPLLVVVIFAIAAIVPSWLVAPPRYDALFTVTLAAYTSRDPGVGEVKYAVDHGHLKAYRRKPPAQHYDVSDGALLLFDAKSGGVREIFVPPLSLTDMTGDWQEFPVPEAQAFTLDASTTSPDGYEFHDRYTYGGEVWPFFNGGPAWHGPSLGKSGREIKIALPAVNDSYSGTTVHFLGWVTSPDQK